MDSGALQFYDHANSCTGRCVSRNSGMSKYDVKIEALTRADSDLVISTLTDTALTILRTMRDDSPRSTTDHYAHQASPRSTVSSDHYTHQPSSTVSPVDGAVVKSEPYSDSNDSGEHYNDGETVRRVSSAGDDDGSDAEGHTMDTVVEG